MFLNAHRPFQTVNSKNFAFERHRRIVLPTADQLAMAKKRNVTRKSSETNKGSPNYGTAKMPLYQQLIRYYLPHCEIFRYQKCYQNFLVFECICLWNKIKKVHHINDQRRWQMHNVVRIGYTGIEPVNYGFRVHCLTIWLIPNKLSWLLLTTIISIHNNLYWVNTFSKIIFKTIYRPVCHLNLTHELRLRLGFECMIPPDNPRKRQNAKISAAIRKII